VTEIHQVLTTASSGDAITNSALELRDLLRKVGPSEIYACHVAIELTDDVLELEDYQRRATAGDGRNVLIYHASIGNQRVLSFLLQRPERLVMQYHNVTPARFFEPWDPGFAQLLREGREQLVGLRTRVALTLADSHFNASELERIGYRDVEVVPPLTDVGHLQAIEADEGTAHHFREAVVGPVVLFVGQLLPHKRPDLLVQLGHVLSTFHDPEARVVIVGNARLEPYRAALVTYIAELNLPNVWITGPVSKAELVAFYEAADIFVTMSEHEGFCIPLIEAMGFDLPIVARRHGAIAETLDQAGVLLPAGAGPELAAEAVIELLDSRERRAAAAASGRERLAMFDADAERALVLDRIGRVL
jgi:glycosyltransferase involved in cell wall biosynthesis